MQEEGEEKILKEQEVEKGLKEEKEVFFSSFPHFSYFIFSSSS